MLKTASGLARIKTESAFDVLARAKALEAQGRSIINLGIGQPDFRSPEHIVEAAIKALRDGHHGYTPANGIVELRQAVSEDLERRHGHPVDADCVLVVPGGKVTMFFAILMFGEAGAEIIYPNPGFPIYESAIAFSGADPVALPLLEANEFAFSAADVLSRITPRTRLIILNSPANPTGGVTPRAEIDALVDGLEAHPHVAVMSDEIYSHLLYGGREHVSLLQYPQIRDRLILLDGWSKSYAMTGWRMGYGLWPRSLVEKATRLAINCHSCVNAAAQYAGIAALNGPQDAIDEMRTAFDRRRRFIFEEINRIDGLSCVDPAGAFYAFPNISRSGRNAKELETALLEEVGIATVAGTSFGEHGEGFLRLSYANSLDNIEEALQRIRRYLGS